jgi:Yip1 domain
MSETNPTTPTRAAENGAPVMSTPQTLSGIFFEPSATFDSLRVRPRFLVAGLVAILIFMASYLTYVQRIGYNEIIDAEISEARKANTDMTDEQAAQGAAIQKGPIVKTIRMASPLIGFAIVFAAGAGIYLLGVSLMGGTISYKQALSVWVYSSLPPLILMVVLNLLLMFLNPPEGASEIVQGAQRGLVHANAGALVDGSAHPVLATALGSLDILSFYGLFLAALGLRKLGRLKSGSAWTVVLLLWGVGVVVRLGLAVAFGRAM